jgi:hypothetical protein
MAAWKEISISIIFLKVLISSNTKSGVRTYDGGFSNLLGALFIGIVVLFFLVSDHKEDALLSLRSFVFPIIMGYCIFRSEFNKQGTERLISWILVSAIISFVVGHMQTYIFPMEFALFHNIAGNNYFGTSVSSAYTILDTVERMYGAFGGPNEFGLYSGIIVVFSLFLFLEIDKYNLKIASMLIILSMVLGVSTLLHAFSRVAWIFALLSSSVVFYSTSAVKRQNKIKVLLAIGFIVAFAFVITPADSSLSRVLSSTVKLEESSASIRPGFLFDGLTMTVQNPLGIGLGLVNYKSSNQLYSTEIFWWLVTLETGILGGLLLASLYIVMVKRLIQNLKTERYLNVFSLPAATFSVVFLAIGFGSVMPFEFTFLLYIWTFIGLGLRRESAADTVAANTPGFR